MSNRPQTAHYVSRAHRANAEYGVELPSFTMTYASQDELVRIADAYAALPDFDGRAVYAWRALADETAAQFQAMARAGIVVHVEDEDPYTSAADMFADVERGVIRVLSTAVTGGHPYWTDEENDIFRAVHDVMGHAATGRGFDRHGEVAAFEHHRTAYSPLARMALATELRGQAAALAVTGEFPPQKVAVLPRELRDADLQFLCPVQRPGHVGDAVQRHLAGGLQLR